MTILAIDPGTTQSAYVALGCSHIWVSGKINNEDMLEVIKDWRDYPLVIERISSYGQRVGKTVFETAEWVGRYIQHYIDVGGSPEDITLIYRNEVKKNICPKVKSNDKIIRRAMIERYGPPGTKKAPGRTYGVSKDMWQALAVGATYYDMQRAKDAANALVRATL